jgi:hypothetical protein
VKNLLLPLLILIGLGANAQYKNDVYSDWNVGYSVAAFGRYQASSNAITSNLVWNTYQGNFLTRDLREKVSGMHTRSNRFGADLDYGIYAKHIPDSAKGIGWFLKIADRTHLNGKYPKELFDFVMFGNAQYAGESINLSPIEFNLITYTQFEIGLLNSISKQKGKWNLGLGISLLTGKRNLRLKIDEAELYTDPNGEYLEGDVTGDIWSSSLSSSQYVDANGIGFSASVHIGYETEKFDIRFEADDLGIINWTKHLGITELDSVFVFDGVEVTLFASDINPVTGINLDSVVDGFATKGVGVSYMSILPGRIGFEGDYALNTKDWKLYAGVQYRFAPSYIPYAYIGTNSPLGKGFSIDGRVAFGGLGNWHLGLDFRKKFSDVAEIRLGTRNLEGFVLPMVGTSQSAYVSIAGYF